MIEVKRFYDTFVPEHYDLFLDINRTKKTITGQVKVQGEAKELNILLHQKDLQIVGVHLNDHPVLFQVLPQQDALQITLQKTGIVQLVIDYTAELTDSMMGIYPSYYQVDGVKKQIIGTQFETTFARQAFPCVDEPEAKATFTLALKFDEHPGEIAISNMPEQKVVGGVHYFEPTVKMSTYLVAFAFGELQSETTQTNSGVQVGVFATKAHPTKNLKFALDIAKRAIEFFEEYYQTPYPLPHSWQLALPDFSAGAMENWGLITYREAYLLLDPENDSLATKISVATVIAHELAHQWFGDLVTMKWWDDLWLNESFANMMEYVAIDALEPDWKVWETFQDSDVPLALQRDAIFGVQPVHVQVEHPAEIDALFDSAIVYAKGARMLVMVRSLIGEQALRTGLKNYFAQHQYHNATGEDLWTALGAAAQLDIKSIMNTWLEQPGYPVVRAQVVNGQLTLTQQQFFVGASQDAGRLWSIPLNGNYAATPQILQAKNITLGDYQKLRDQAGHPFQLNCGNSSHFIVQYDKLLLTDLLTDLPNLAAIDQQQLLQDLHLLAESGAIAYADLMTLMTKFADSPSNIVINALYKIMNDVKKFAVRDAVTANNLRQFFDKLSGSKLQDLGYEPRTTDTLDDQLVRPIILKASLYAKNKQTMQALHAIYQRYDADLATLPADIRYSVLLNEVQNYGNLALQQHLLTTYQTTANSSFKRDLQQALTGSPDKQWLNKLVTSFEDSKVIKPQDLRAWFAGILANRTGQQLAWDWIRNDWSWLERTVGGDMEFTTYITVISSTFSTAQRLQEFTEFFEPKLETPGLTREITMDTQIIQQRVTLVDKEYLAMVTQLAKCANK
ncbi:M1 family metallopeptidase [Bombilactobacillus thymidiniphilus]|uniref:Aminopeptidase n=1 Tax=Bombilactobacillus thymidiniphilus TaxID=2923363 RepID=A0ABY4PC59_9LACO|nr:M1 family metallopeptidase [Bombilactobacillus thymidiniphilus]UQS83175.1 M1 family metallopeptidase [Bombilactobacillus thymidiniphilus]